MFTKNYYYGLVKAMANQSAGGFPLEQLDIKTVGGLTGPTLATLLTPDASHSNVLGGSESLFEGPMSDTYITNQILGQISQGANYSMSISNAYGFIFGTGNTPATVNDYWLSGDPVYPSSYSYLIKREPFIDGNIIGWSFLYTITNISANSITIGEIGHFNNWELFHGSKSRYYNLMVQRTAFDTPVTIAPDGVGQVTFKIAMPIPTA